MSDGSPHDDLRAELGRLVRQLVQEGDDRADEVVAALASHLGTDSRELPVHGEELPAFELANLQVGLDAALARAGFHARVLGLAGPGRHYSDANLGDLLAGSHMTLGAPEYVNAAVGPKTTRPCLALGLLLVTSPDGPLVVFVRRGAEHGPVPGLLVQTLAPEPEVARTFLDDLRRLMDEHDVFRGQLLTIEATRHGASEVVFLERTPLAAEELILPDGVLDRVERHVVGPTRYREELLARGRHLGRGLLLWGPPGTGKTHTVRYLAARLTDATIVILSGSSLGLVGAFGNLARRLSPAVVVLEDVDLIAQERTFGPFGSSPVLFELMNEMSGLAEDADVAFVLTTNRPDALEPALAARPGRVDLAVEIPLPDAAARRALLGLYARGLDVDAADLDTIVTRTDGVTASFFKELLRKATLASVEAGEEHVSSESLVRALDELLHESSALTRVLLGGAEPSTSGAPSPHAWIETFPVVE